MPGPRRFSRYLFCLGFHDDVEDVGDGALQLTDREPFSYVQLPDNRAHTVGRGDTLHSLAARYFAPIENPANLWWVIADFQPEPIHDPTIELTPGQVLVIPSVRTVLESVFSDTRRGEVGL